MKRNIIFKIIRHKYSKIDKDKNQNIIKSKIDTSSNQFDIKQIEQNLYNNGYLYWYRNKYNDMGEKAYKNIDQQQTYYSAFDGASKQQGKSSCAFVIYKPDKKILYQDSFFTGMNTNNYAEFLGAAYLIQTMLFLGIIKRNKKSCCLWRF